MAYQFGVKGRSTSALDELLAMKAQRDAISAKEEKNKETARIKQETADRKTVLTELPHQLEVDNGNYMIDGEKADLASYNQALARNQQIRLATQRLNPMQQPESQNYPPNPNAGQVATSNQGSFKQTKNQKPTNTYKDGTPKMGALDKVKLMPEMLRQGLSSFMSGNRGGQVIGQPNTGGLPAPVIADAYKNQVSQGMIAPKDTKLNRDAQNMGMKGRDIVANTKPSKQTLALNRKLESRFARKKMINEAKDEYGNLVSATKDKFSKTKNRFADARDEVKRDTYALWQQTPSAKDMVKSYAQGVKGRVQQIANFATKNLFPQSREIQYAKPSAGKSKKPVKKRYTKYGSPNSPE